MARDNQLPVSRPLARVSPRLHTPVWSCIAVGALSAIPFIQFAGASTIAVGATASIYFSYLLGNAAVMRARTKGWPKTRAPFSLGKWGKLVNALALLWGGSMLINFLWPASGKFGETANSLRIFSNPRPNETDYYGTGPLVHLGMKWLNDIPIIWTVMVVIIGIGAIYYFGFQRRKPWTPVSPPEGEELPVTTA
jgi:hypothetical protein